MNATQRKILLRAAICGWTALLAGSARAGNHTWNVNEIFSNFDGTIQFIELFEANGAANEVGMPGQTISTNAHNFVLPGETLEPPTTNKFQSPRRNDARNQMPSGSTKLPAKDTTKSQ